MSNLTIIRASEFTSNRVIGDSGKGGAVYIWRANSTINDSSFISNLVNGSNAEGGALTLRETTSVITNSLYKSNVANGRSSEGGAVYVRESNISINESIFSSNRASKDGGALAIRDSNSTIESNIFYDNIAGENGGVMHFFQLVLDTSMLAKITDNTFVDNTTTESVRLLSAENNVIDAAFQENCVCRCSSCVNYTCDTDCSSLLDTIQGHDVTSTIAVTDHDVTSTIAVTSSVTDVTSTIAVSTRTEDVIEGSNSELKGSLLITITVASVSGTVAIISCTLLIMLVVALACKRIRRNSTRDEARRAETANEPHVAEPVYEDIDLYPIASSTFQNPFHPQDIGGVDMHCQANPAYGSSPLPRPNKNEMMFSYGVQNLL